MIWILWIIIGGSLLAILLVLGLRTVFRGFCSIQTELFDLSLKYGTKISRPCSVCGVEVWLGYDGYDFEGKTFCGQHKPKQLTGYYKI